MPNTIDSSCLNLLESFDFSDTRYMQALQCNPFISNFQQPKNKLKFKNSKVLILKLKKTGSKSLNGSSVI